jgi:hypothetical protein
MPVIPCTSLSPRARSVRTAFEIRHPVFHAIREDKPARAVTEELVRGVDSGEPDEQRTGSMRVRPGPCGTVIISDVKLSNPGRPIAQRRIVS